MKKWPYYALFIISLLICLSSLLVQTVSTYASDGTAVVKTVMEDIFIKIPEQTMLHAKTSKVSGNKKGTVIHIGGYKADEDASIDGVAWLKEAGFEIIALDYGDYAAGSLSDPARSIGEMSNRARVAIEAIINLPGVKTAPVYILGQGIGGALAVYAVATTRYKEEISGLILESSFPGYSALTGKKLKAIGAPSADSAQSGQVDDEFSPAKWIHDISPVPVIIIHGETDAIVPLRSGLILYDLAQRPKELMIAEGKGHLGGLADKQVRKRIIARLGRSD